MPESKPMAVVLQQPSEHLVLPLRKRPYTGLDIDDEASSKLARTAECERCGDAEDETTQGTPFVLMRLSSVYETGVPFVRNRHYTTWVPFSTRPDDLRALLASLEAVEQTETALRVHSYISKGRAVYEAEAAVCHDLNKRGRAYQMSHVSMIDTSGIDLDQSWPRVAGWNALAAPRVFTLAQ